MPIPPPAMPAPRAPPRRASLTPASCANRFAGVHYHDPVHHIDIDINHADHHGIAAHDTDTHEGNIGFRPDASHDHADVTHTHEGNIGVRPDASHESGHDHADASHEHAAGAADAAADHAPTTADRMDPFPMGSAMVSPKAALAPPVCASADGPVAQSVANREARCKASRASPAHLVLATHAITLATMQGISKGDMTDLGDDAVLNAQSVTPVGAFIVRELLKEKERVCMEEARAEAEAQQEPVVAAQAEIEQAEKRLHPQIVAQERQMHQMANVVAVRKASFFRRPSPPAQIMALDCSCALPLLTLFLFLVGTLPSHHRSK